MKYAKIDEAIGAIARGDMVLVVDDDHAVRTVLRVNLSKHGMHVDTVDTARAALAALHESSSPAPAASSAVPPSPP